jgi:hypothetical protein
MPTCLTKFTINQGSRVIWAAIPKFLFKKVHVHMPEGNNPVMNDLISGEMGRETDAK